MNKLLGLLIIFSISSYSQTHNISQYEKYDNENRIVNYYNKLGENENSLLLKINDNKFIVYKNDFEIYKISIGYLSGLIIKKEKINDLRLTEYKAVLDSLIKLNPFKLNETKNKITNQALKIQDGSNYNLQLMKQGYFVDYNSYAPLEYIEFKAVFYEERIKFLNIFKKANDLFKDNNEEYLKIKKSDTLYFESPAKELIKKLNIVEVNTNYSNSYNFNLQKKDIIVLDKKNAQEFKKFPINMKYEILSFDLFDLYGFEILKNFKKTIFIIELKGIKKNNKRYYKASYINVY